LTPDRPASGGETDSTQEISLCPRHRAQSTHVARTVLKVLVVEDEQDLCELIAESLEDEGYEVSCAADGAEALAAAAATPFDLVLADMRLPKIDGLTLFRRLREECPDTDVIVMTGNAAVPDAVAVLKEGAFDYLTKPVNLDELAVQLQRLATYRSLRQNVAAIRSELGAPVSSRAQLVGHSEGMLRLIKRMDTIAQSDAQVVITGESGTGKELVARALHEGSSRRSKPFIAVNCAAFPDTLIEAELFGHERGAFTDATSRRDGRFKAANGGTLFLDEVAELSHAAQAKLLRVLQEGTIEPLGSNETIKVDVRVVSATHRDLRARIAEGLFREDLYYRINTLDIEIPPLRARGGDLAVLVQHFIKRFSNPRGETAGITWRAWNALSTYSFPGNVRELMHTIQHAVVLAGGRQIDVEHLPTHVRGEARAVAPPRTSPMVPLSTALKQFERAYLIRTLAECDDKKSKAADSLGISRKNLWEKLRMHGIGQHADAASDATIRAADRSFAN
jgi:DNA-binding NtrC family response regulator